MAYKISDAFQGALTGGLAGTSTLGGLGMAGVVGKGLALSSPWAWGLMGGGVGLGLLSSFFGEDDPQEELAKEQTKQLKQLNRRRSGTAAALGTMFTGANLAPGPMASGRLE